MKSLLKLSIVCALIGFFFPTGVRAAAPPPLARPLVGAIRYDQWQSGLNALADQHVAQLGPRQWRYRLPFFGREVSPDQVRLDQGNQAVMDQEIAFAKAAGIDYWAFNHASTGAQRQMINLYLNSSRKSDIRFCLDLATFPEFRLDDAVNLITTQPTYQKVAGGRPLVHFMAWYDLATRADVDNFRARVIQAGGLNPYIVCQHFNAATAAAYANQLGLDAIGAYAQGMGGPSFVEQPFSTLAANARAQWDQYRNTGKKVVPTVMTGWDARPDPSRVGDPYFAYATPQQIASHLRDAINWAAANPGAAAEANTILIYAWTEITEGGWLVPSNPAFNPVGNGRLDAIAEVLGGVPGPAVPPPPPPSPPAIVSITSPVAGKILNPGETVVAAGGGSNLVWGIDRLSDAAPDFAGGTGGTVTFTVPADAMAGEQILIELRGDGGSVLQAYSIGGTGGGTPPPPPSLLAWWQLDDGSGAQALDASGNGVTGNLQGGPVWTAQGMIGGALGFGGGGAHVDYGASGGLNFAAGASFTVAAWVKTQAAYGTILSQRNGADGGAVIDLCVGFDGAANSPGSVMALVRQNQGTGGFARVTGGAVNDGAWHHVALVRSPNGQIELFLDGASQGTDVGSQSAGAITTTARGLGGEIQWEATGFGTPEQRSLNGQLDDVRIYAGALSTSDITALATASGSGGTGGGSTSSGGDSSGGCGATGLEVLLVLAVPALFRRTSARRRE